MKKFIAIIVLSIIAIGCSKTGKSISDIEYNVRSNLKDSIPKLHVSFNFKSDHNGFIVLRYENNSWGDNDIFNCIKKIEKDPQPQNIEFNRDSSQIKIKTKPYSNTTIQYDIGQDFEGPPLNKYRYRPILDSGYFHILGMRLFMVPERIFEADISRAKIKITYNEKASNELFHSSFGLEKVQNIEVDREELYASFFVGGDFRRSSFTIAEDTVYFITRGNWQAFKDEAIFSILKETISAQQTFWNDPRKGMFSVILLPAFESWTENSKANSIGGSGFSSSFVSFASNNEGTTLNKMRWLYNHELLHKWIGRTIVNENEVEQYWFSEGFTDYYSYKLMLKNDYLNVPEFIDIINDEVKIPHYRDPVNCLPNAEITFDEYWTNYAKYMKLPYRRGFLYAFLIDNQIKEQNDFTKSLDNLMHDLFEMALNDKSLRFNHSLFVQQLLKYLNHNDVESDFKNYILEGQLIDFEEDLSIGISINYQDNIPIFKIDFENYSELEKKLKL